MKNHKAMISIIAVVALAGGLVYALFSLKIQQNPSPEGVMCTMEALLCPDGSGVGRGGPECRFSACPNQPSFTGILKQDSNGFKLILDSPSTEGQGVAYSMPLVIKVTNVLGQLVDKKVRVYGSFTEGATYSVERLEELTGAAGDSTLGEVAVGKTVFINGVRVTLNKITQDSRCPSDVQCIQAGSITANITLESDTDKETVDISSNASSPKAFDSYQVSIENAKPYPISTSSIKPESYVLTFRVRSN